MLQSCPTLCDPTDGSPPGCPVPWILQARTLEWFAISFSNAWKWKVKMKSLSRVRLVATPWTAAYQAPPSMGFSRQKYWSGVPLPSPTPPSKCGQSQTWPGYPAGSWTLSQWRAFHDKPQKYQWCLNPSFQGQRLKWALKTCGLFHCLKSVCVCVCLVCFQREVKTGGPHKGLSLNFTKLFCKF